MHRTKAQAMQRPFFLSLLSLRLFSSSDKRWVGKIISKLTNWPIPNIRHTSYFKHLCQGTGHIYFLQQCFLDLLFETILSMETHGGMTKYTTFSGGFFSLIFCKRGSATSPWNCWCTTSTYECALGRNPAHLLCTSHK